MTVTSRDPSATCLGVTLFPFKINPLEHRDPCDSYISKTLLGNYIPPSLPWATACTGIYRELGVMWVTGSRFLQARPEKIDLGAFADHATAARKSILLQIDPTPFSRVLPMGGRLRGTQTPIQVSLNQFSN
jgi:hypothetical protein